MATTTVEPKAHKRRRKTRTKNVSPLPALIASEVKAGRIDLTPGKEHLVCPACKSWTPITGVSGKPQLVPHHTTPYRSGVSTPRRCPNSNRRIVLDMTAADWQASHAQRVEVTATVSSIRPTKVLPKAFSPQTDQILQGRSEQGAVGRRADWRAALRRVRQTDQLRRTVPQGEQPTEGPDVPLFPRQAAAQPEGRLRCEHCGATESSLDDAVAAGWCRITRRTHCGTCAGRFPVWTRISF